jgi:hypothetical protein
MNEEDLRDCFAMFAMFSRTFGEGKELDARICYQIADLMLEARKVDEEGIVAIKKRVNRKVKNGSD